MSFCVHPWKYVNEGNVHIVLQILDSDYVLRLIKEDICKTKKANISQAVEFVNSVVIPLIFSDRKYQEEILEISTEEIVELTKSLHQFRPKNRIYKSRIMTTAIKAPNLTMVISNPDNFCIEIKPKEGYLANSLKEYSKCYYCMKQYLKLNENHIEHVSNYCPLDLFSGDTDRMKFALKSLIDNPQNNFKFFKNANVIYKENIPKQNFETLLKELDVFGNSVNLFLDFIIQILLSDGKSDITVLPTNENSLTKSQYCRDGNNLKNNSFLYKLLDLQRLSEKFTYTPGICDKLDYVMEILKEIETQNLDLTNADHRKIFFTWNQLYLALTSAIVKDCSIMLSFTTNINNEYPKVTIGERKMAYKVGVTDLEPKPAKVLHKRIETEKKLLDIYAKIALTSK